MSADTDGRLCRPPLEPDDDPALRSRLARSHVAIVGCGGLGSNVAAMLLRSGVGELTLIDFDLVEHTNLNRQLYFADQIGRPKTEALAETLRRIVPAVRLNLVQQCVTEHDLVGIVAGAHVVIEAVDRADVKAMIANTLLREHPEIPLVGASGLAGLDSANAVVTERMVDSYYLVGDLVSDVHLGHSLFASRVMVAAAHQAHAAIRILLGYPEP